MAVVASGGIDLRAAGIDVVARGALPSALAASALLCAWLALARREWRGDVAWLGAAIGGGARWLAVALAIGTFALAVRFNTFTAGGSDSYCYVEQAERFAAGTLLEPSRPGFETPWADADRSLAPTGFVPSRVVDGAIAPICPAGLALAMAVPRALGAPRVSVFYVVPLFAALTVWSAFVIGRRLGGPGAGVAVAALTAASPVFLFQAVQPMSDVPAAALWTAALALAGRRDARGLAGGGLAAGAGALMRPNLGPLALLLAGYAMLAVGGEARDVASRVRRAALVSVGVLLAAVAIALLQDAIYGSPLSSGYGSLDALFDRAHVGPNMRRYVPWLVETQSWVVLLAAAAPMLAWMRGTSRDVAYAGLLALVAGGVMAAYLPYVPFEEWWFLRFWLPAIPALIALAVASLAWIAGGFPSAQAPGGHGVVVALARVLALTVTVALAAWQLGVARERGVFGIAEAERKFVASGEFVRSSLPREAVVLTIWHSGSVRYYGERPTILWDAIAPGDLDVVLASLEAQGRPAYLLLEDWEREDFTARFAGHPLAALDWPPAARVGRQVSIWAVADRARFLRGEPVGSERVW